MCSNDSAGAELDTVPVREPGLCTSCLMTLITLYLASRLLAHVPSPLSLATLGQLLADVSTSFHRHTRMIPVLPQL